MTISVDSGTSSGRNSTFAPIGTYLISRLSSNQFMLQCFWSLCVAADLVPRSGSPARCGSTLMCYTCTASYMCVSGSRDPRSQCWPRPSGISLLSSFDCETEKNPRQWIRHNWKHRYAGAVASVLAGLHCTERLIVLHALQVRMDGSSEEF